MNEEQTKIVSKALLKVDEAREGLIECLNETDDVYDASSILQDIADSLEQLSIDLEATMVY